MRKYCDECGREVETTITAKKEIYDVCGEPVEVDAQILLCADCGGEFYSEELDNAMLVRHTANIAGGTNSFCQRRLKR